MKTLFIILIVLYVVYKLTGFIVRTILRNVGITPQSGPFYRAGAGPAAGNSPNSAQAQTGKRSPNITDGVGEYVEFEEVK